MTDDPFEIPQSLRDASEQNLQQAHAVYEQILEVMTKALDTWMGALPANPLTAGLQEVQGHIMEIAKENAEAAFTLAGQISNAPSLQDVLTLQTQFAHDRLQTFVTQTQQLFSVFAGTFQPSERGAWMDTPTTTPPRSTKDLLH